MNNQSNAENTFRTQTEAEEQQIKYDNLLYLHNTDHSSLVLVSNVLTEHNYMSWSRSMMTTLEALDKLGFITGEVEIPSANSPLHNVIVPKCKSMIMNVKKQRLLKLNMVDGMENIAMQVKAYPSGSFRFNRIDKSFLNMLSIIM
ncbi:hypothetical protein LIER_27181 [Lithospermum erythrorhizon]|uniref:Retrotransposon Copia-like N-terminal domain-containing protein n=1 Tax=Lithospermum erythrorhizon TaxID=34254 RepID=A0AAV3RER7_LITER